MKSSTFLQIFLLVDVFLIGVAASAAIRHALAHFRPHEHEPEKHPVPAQNGHLPPAVREQLLAKAQTNFQNVLDRSAAELAHDLEGTGTRLNKLLEQLGTEVASKEMERYRTELEDIRKQTEAATQGAQAELAQHQVELKAKLAEEIETEKRQLLAQIDAKLADAVVSFLTETLQHDIDLGAQAAYLTRMLEEHKAELAKEVVS